MPGVVQRIRPPDAGLTRAASTRPATCGRVPESPAAVVGSRLASRQRPWRRPLRWAAGCGVRVRARCERRGAGRRDRRSPTRRARASTRRRSGAKRWPAGSTCPRSWSAATTDGVTLADAMRAPGSTPTAIGDAPSWRSGVCRASSRSTSTRAPDVARADAPVGIVSCAREPHAPRGLVDGRADHAGTTPRAERQDALPAAARLIVAAEELGSELGVTVTTSRSSRRAERPDDDRLARAAVDRRAFGPGRTTRRVPA